MISGKSIYSILPPPCRGRVGVGVETEVLHDSTPILTFHPQGVRRQTLDLRSVLAQPLQGRRNCIGDPG
jgi:hypothetical protein